MSTVDSFYIGKKPVLEMKMGNSTFYKTPGWDSFSGPLGLTKKANLNNGRLLGSDKNGHLIFWVATDKGTLYITDNDGENKNAINVFSKDSMAGARVERYSGLILATGTEDQKTFLIDIKAGTKKQLNYTPVNTNLNLASSNNNLLFGADLTRLYLVTDTNTDSPKIKAFLPKELYEKFFLGVSFYGGYFYLLSSVANSIARAFQGPFYLHKLNSSGEVLNSKKLDNFPALSASIYYTIPSAYDEAGSLYISLLDQSTANNNHYFIKIMTDGTVTQISEPKSEKTDSTGYPFTIDGRGSLYIIRKYYNSSSGWKCELYTYGNNLSKSSLISFDTGTYYIESLSDGRILIQKDLKRSGYGDGYTEDYYGEVSN